MSVMCFLVSVFLFVIVNVCITECSAYNAAVMKILLDRVSKLLQFFHHKSSRKILLVDLSATYLFFAEIPEEFIAAGCSHTP